MTADWFTTSPEAVLRAESILAAFNDTRLEDIGAILAMDYDDPDVSPIHTLVALVCMCDRLADHVARIEGVDVPDAVREAARVVAEAYYRTTEP